MPTQGQVVAAILDAGRQANFTNSNFYNLVAVAIAANDPDALSRVIITAFASGFLTQPDVDSIMAIIPGSPN
jgi:hypothetical protein